MNDGVRPQLQVVPPPPSNVIPLIRVLEPPPAVYYEAAAIHEGVVITRLLHALNRHGLTVSNVTGHGLVIHRLGDDPRQPVPAPSTTERETTS